MAVPSNAPDKFVFGMNFVVIMFCVLLPADETCMLLVSENIVFLFVFVAKGLLLKS